MDKLKKIGLLVLMCLVQLSVWAQQMDNKTQDPSDFMHSNGKIYVVVAVVVTIVLGIFIYLVNLDRKISKLEKK